MSWTDSNANLVLQRDAVEIWFYSTWFFWCYHLQLKKWTLTHCCIVVKIITCWTILTLRQSHVHVLACTSLNRQVSTYLLAGAERVRALSINLLPALSYGVIQLYIETGNSISGQSFTSLATTKGWLLPCQRHGQCHQDIAKESGLTGEITVVLALCVSTTPPSEEPPWNNQRLEQLKSKLVWSRGSDMECRIHIQRPVLERNKKQSTHKGSRMFQVSFIIFFHLDSAGMSDLSPLDWPIHCQK